MKRVAICLVTLGILALSNCDLLAADQAATPQLPAALQALSGGGAEVLSCQDARSVRGQNLGYWVGGVVVSQTYVFTGSVAVASIDPYVVQVTLLPWYFSFQAQ